MLTFWCIFFQKHIYIFINIHTHTYVYIYIDREREWRRREMYIHLYAYISCLLSPVTNFVWGMRTISSTGKYCIVSWSVGTITHTSSRSCNLQLFINYSINVSEFPLILELKSIHTHTHTFLVFIFLKGHAQMYLNITNFSEPIEMVLYHNFKRLCIIQ